jgi:hypothetical protein
MMVESAFSRLARGPLACPGENFRRTQKNFSRRDAETQREEMEAFSYLCVSASLREQTLPWIFARMKPFLLPRVSKVRLSLTPYTSIWDFGLEI